MNKKAGFMETTLGKVVLGLIIIIVLLGIVMLFTGKLHDVWAGFLKVFRFGG